MWHWCAGYGTNIKPIGSSNKAFSPPRKVQLHENYTYFFVILEQIQPKPMPSPLTFFTEHRVATIAATSKNIAKRYTLAGERGGDAIKYCL